MSTWNLLQVPFTSRVNAIRPSSKDTKRSQERAAATAGQVCCEEVQLSVDLCSGDRCGRNHPAEGGDRTTFGPLSQVWCESEPRYKKAWTTFTSPHEHTNLLWQSAPKRTERHPVGVELLSNSGSDFQPSSRVQLAHLLNDKGSVLCQSPGDNWLQHTALQAAVSTHR